VGEPVGGISCFLFLENQEKVLGSTFSESDTYLVSSRLSFGKEAIRAPGNTKRPGCFSRSIGGLTYVWAHLDSPVSLSQPNQAGTFISLVCGAPISLKLTSSTPKHQSEEFDHFIRHFGQAHGIHCPLRAPFVIVSLVLIELLDRSMILWSKEPNLKSICSKKER
jgi:hypothetical protein